MNLQRSELATAELPALSDEERLSLVLVQEPYLGRPLEGLLTPSCEGVGAGIYVRDARLTVAVLHHLCTRNCMVCHIAGDDIYVVSAYFQYSEDIAPHLEHITGVLEHLRGKHVLIGVDSNAHSPMWHSLPRHYVGRGYRVCERREQMEDFLLARRLTVHNAPDQPFTFATENGESNIDVTVTTAGLRVEGWRVLPDASSSDHRLISYRVVGRQMRERGAAREGATSGPTPVRFRERGVDWARFRSRVHERVGSLRWDRPASDIARELTQAVGCSAYETLGEVGTGRKTRGYEWWTPALDALRKSCNRARKVWQMERKRGGALEGMAKREYHDRRSRYRKAMGKAQLDYFREVAEAGNGDPWGLAYRAVSGRLRPPPNVINCVELAEGLTGDAGAAMRGLLGALFPDDSEVGDTEYHGGVRSAAACVPLGRDAPPPSGRDMWDIVRNLPNTAPGIDGISARIVKQLWEVAGAELTAAMGRCVTEGVFPDAWKEGRLVTVPKGNGRPLTDPKAYRPITLLPVLGKILERVILHCAPSIQEGASSCQHGFTRGRSTLSALNEVLSIARESGRKYVQAIFLDISGAFDNAWWPMILLKAKNRGCPPNIYNMLRSYFSNRRVGLFVGGRVEWKTSTMGCPQGSVLGPALWNLLMDDLFELPYPDGVRLVAYADDVTVLIESDARSGIEASASCAMGLISEWGTRNRLAFSPAKSYSMTIKGGLARRPPTIRLGGASVASVRSTRVLGVVIDSGLSFGEHAKSIGERAASGFGKMTRVSAASWGVRYRALKVLYKGIFTATITYAAGCWWRRVSVHVVGGALLRAQRPALVLLTKAYRSTSTAALPVLAGVLPADLEVARAGRIDELRTAPRDVLRAGRKTSWDIAIRDWQARWEAESRGRELFRFFPDVAARVRATWVEPDYQVSQILTGHGCFRKRLNGMRLCERAECYCGEEDEDVDHVLWRCPMYEDERKRMLDGIVRREEGPVYYGDLVSGRDNFALLRAFARRWHRRRAAMEWGEASSATSQQVQPPTTTP